MVFDYTPTRERAGPEQFLKTYRGYLQADAYVAYDSFFTNPERGLVEVACWAHTRRHFHQALDTDSARMGAVLAYIAHLYKVEKRRGRAGIVGEDLRLLREQASEPVLEKLHEYLEKIREEVLPKSEAGQAVDLRAEELDGVDALLGRRRPVDRQQPHRAELARHRGGPAQLDLRGQRSRRQDDGGAAELRGLVRIGEGGSVRLVSRMCSRASGSARSSSSTSCCPTAGLRAAHRVIPPCCSSSRPLLVFM